MLRSAVAHGQSEPPTARLSVVRAEGAESCHDDRAISDEVRARLGREAIDPRAPRAIELWITREPRRWRAALTLREPGAPPARRELSSELPSCAELDASVALAVALVIDPIGADRPVPRAPVEPVPARAVPMERPREAPRSLVAPATRPTPPAIDAWNRGEQLSLAGGVLVGSVPLSAMVRVGFEGARRGLVRPWLSATRSFEAALLDRAGTTRTLGFSRTNLTLGACVGAANERFSVDGCGAFELGLVTSVLYDVRTLEPVRPGDYPWLALALSARGAVRLWGPVSVELGASPSLSVLRQRFVIEGASGAAFEQSLVGLDVWLAGRARFW